MRPRRKRSNMKTRGSQFACRVLRHVFFVTEAKCYRKLHSVTLERAETAGYDRVRRASLLLLNSCYLANARATAAGFSVCLCALYMFMLLSYDIVSILKPIKETARRLARARVQKESLIRKVTVKNSDLLSFRARVIDTITAEWRNCQFPRNGSKCYRR